MITAFVPTAAVFGAAPGSVYPSMVTGFVIAGRSAFNVIVCNPVPMSKLIVGLWPTSALTARIANLSDPICGFDGESNVLVTMNGSGRAAMTVAASEKGEVSPVAGSREPFGAIATLAIAVTVAREAASRLW